MTGRTTTTRVLHCLLVAGLLVAIAGQPLVECSASGTLPVTPPAKMGDGTDVLSSGLKFDSFELIAIVGTADESTSPVYALRVADDSVDPESAFAAAHLERGPPVC